MGLLLVTAIFERRRAPPNPRSDDGIDWEELALMYMLLGAVATALGNISADGWFFGTCFLLIFGGLTTSV